MSNSIAELGFNEIVNKYPDFPQIIIRKIDTGLRGIVFTEKALEKAKDQGALFEAGPEQGLKEPRLVVGGTLFRDGTFTLGQEVVTIQSPDYFLRRGLPYSLDVIDDKFWLIDGSVPVEEIDLAPIPEFYGKRTSRGTPMTRVIYAGPPDCLNINVFGYCHFWKEKLPCKYCSLVPYFLLEKTHTEDSLNDIYETLSEALKEEGRWTSIRIIAGSDPRGESLYQNEVDEYLRVLETVRRAFGTDKIYARLVASAYPVKQLERLKDAGVTSYEPHIEVWDKEIFKWVCPGKDKYYGWQYWVDNAVAAVSVFGRGNVCSQLVAGAELAQPVGFKTIDDALNSSLEGVDYFARHGVTTSYCVLWTAKGSKFYLHKNGPAPLEYYVRLAKGMHEIRRKYKLAVDFNDFKRCAIHPDTDLARLDYNKVSYEPISIEEVK